MFTTTLHINGQPIEFDVSLYDDKAEFTSQSEGASPSTFRFERQGEAWIALDEISPDIKQHALSALEKYLLSQH